jgi:uncharacterized protein YjiS (DUF1127 family)
LEDSHEHHHWRFRAHRSSRWRELNRVIGEWWQHQRSLHELETLGDTILRDIGLFRDEARFHASRPFWFERCRRGRRAL